MRGKETITLAELAEVITDGTRLSLQFADQGIPYLRLSNITFSGITKQNLEYIKSHKEIEEKAIVRKGDLLLTKAGVTGKVALATGQFDGAVIGPDIVRIRLKREEDAAAVLSFLRTEEGQLLLKQKIQGSVIPKISIKDLRSLKVPLNIVEQSISLDLTLEREQKKQKFYQRWQQSYGVGPEYFEPDPPPLEFFLTTEEISTHRLDFYFYQAQKTRAYSFLSELIQRDAWFPVMEVARLVRKAVSPKEWLGKEIRYIGLTNVEYCPFVVSSADRVLFNKVDSRARFIGKRGDIILGIVGPHVGKADQPLAVITPRWEGAFIASSFAVIRPHRVSPPYLLWCLHHPFVRYQLQSVVRGQQQKMVSLSDVENLLIPPLDQEKAAVVDNMIREYLELAESNCEVR